jgi:signal transduction histidine kinase/ActR/RegA family two-component response regulator
MLIPFLQKRLKDISIARKLYFTIGIMALLITVELCTLWFSISTLSSVRAFVNGEGLWSKAQKDAIYSLFIYAHSHDEKDYQDFRIFLKVPYGDNKTRLELLKPNPDLQVARQGFIEGRNEPVDVDGMISLLTRFHKEYYLNKAIVIWGEAEKTIEDLITISERLHAMIISKTATQEEIDKELDRAEIINRKLTKLEDDFSFTLGEGARWLEKIVLRLLLTLSLTIGTTSILITISVSRAIEKGIKAIIDGAALITKGLLNTRVKVYSRDEIGTLATSFNHMIDTLEHNTRNIRELKEAEEKLKKEKERAETSEKAKQLFLAKMSHEIRTPMNAILGFAKLLEESLETKEQQQFIHIIIKSGDDLLVILNDILDFSRMEAGKITFENAPFNLRSIVETTVLMMELKSKQKGIDLKYTIDDNIPETLVGDSVRLNQVLLNLVSNALKFTETGEISISVNCVEAGVDNLLLDFRVKDTGMGIPLEKLEKIFESFEQATNDTARKFGGAGLGLSIVKQLVTLQNGEISVRSKPGEGSEFCFKLSFLRVKGMAKPIARKLPLAISANGRGINVLVAEDNMINQMLVIRILKRQGFETDVAENGLITLDKHKNNHFDVILMDLQMPEMDGYEATRMIREMDGIKKKVPIIAMSAHTIKGEYERCIEIGMNDFISKPFDTNELYEKIYKLVKKRRKPDTSDLKA